MSRSMLSTLSQWLSRRSDPERLTVQLTLNSAMLFAVMALHTAPWLALLVLSVLLACTIVIQGGDKAVLIVVYGVFGWIGEVWIVGFGRVWTFANPTTTGLDGGLFGVPFYTVVTWAMVGALMLVLQPVLAPRRSDH
jgi:hypothetical protein